MKSNVIETIIGAVVLTVAIGFVVFAYNAAGSSGASGYQVGARFNKIDGLNLGSDVRLSGIKVGTVSKMSLDPESYEAIVEMTIDSNVKLYDGTAAKITSAGLLGSSYIALDPGGGFDEIKDGSEITHTTGSVDLMELIGKFIFSNSDDGDSKDKK